MLASKPLPWVLLICFSLIFFSASALAADDPFIGKWKLDLAKSKLTGQKIEIRLSGTNGFTFKEDEHSDVIIADGLDQPTHYGDTMSITQTKTDTWAITYKREGNVVLNTLWKVSRDGKQLTWTGTGIRPNGVRFNNQMTAKRIGGDSGLAGTWETTEVKLSSPREIYIGPNGLNGHVVTFPGRRQTVRMSFDGKEYPDEGPTVAEGATTAGRRLDARTIRQLKESRAKSLR